MRRRDYIHVGDMVLVSIRDFEPDKVDVVFKYSLAEAAQVQSYDMGFARLAMAQGGDGNNADEDMVVFADSEGAVLDLSLI
jgi:hypothetical protein